MTTNTMTTSTLPATSFTLPPGHEATEPPERRGVTRDGVRLLVARPGQVEHRHFRDLAEFLEPGDLVVVNTSATLPAAFDAVRATGERVPVHLSTVLDDDTWVVEVRRRDGHGPDDRATRGQLLHLPGGVQLDLIDAYPDASATTSRLWRADVTPPTDAARYLSGHGRPITYDYLRGQYSLADYQTVYATEPGSAEMPSAGRPFTETLLVRLMARGVTVAPIILHAGVSSPEAHEPPLPERFHVPEVTARLVNSAHAAGKRVIAVGTTVVRALESAATADGDAQPSRGWTSLVLGPDRAARIVGGLVTGLHDPAASHLLLLEAIAGPDLIQAAYEAAVDRGYLWHEFGDSTLLLP
ncbi:S-adenosylmethionine:tRNA ribosyltransferase-isomerase [Actinophytocola sp.]|uniref:S-adenosylmethionine:tRNA ribosyltransferase-isomerase n=1 Tax=Actinophytocola sp. TaxID=1872138 RepID=UPI0025C29155|nr:S-adenosylmethionine:tRNA ribosyltransferase-isomerase [Actinophytocola sp.]